MKLNFMNITQCFCREVAKRARKGRVAGISFAIFAALAVTLYAQNRGTPSTLRVKIDSTGALAVSSAAITNPITTVVFNNARLAVDSNGYLVVTDGSGAGFAPANATYILKTANASLTNAQSLGVLNTGLLLNTKVGTTGTLSQYAGATCTNQFIRVLSSLGAATCASVSLTADISGVLPVANGGTNISSYAIGDILYASASGVLSKLADVATGSVLVSGGVGVAPTYSSSPTISALTVTANGNAPINITSSGLNAGDPQLIFTRNTTNDTYGIGTIQFNNSQTSLELGEITGLNRGSGDHGSITTRLRTTAQSSIVQTFHLQSNDETSGSSSSTAIFGEGFSPRSPTDLLNIYGTESIMATPTVAQVVTGSGNSTNGTHVFKVTCVTPGGETLPSSASSSVTIDGTHKQATVTLTTCSQFATGRNVYASAANTTTPLFRITTTPVINNNTSTSYTFNTADGSFTATNPPTSNSAIDLRAAWTAGGLLDILGRGTSSLPAIRFGGDLTSGFYSSGSLEISIAINTARIATFKSTGLDLAGNILNGFGSINISTIVFSSTAPTIASGGCTSPAVTSNNGTAAFLLTIGTSCTGIKTIVLTMPTATHFWHVNCDNNTSDAQQQTNYVVARATSTTAVTITSYDRVTGLQEDFTASDTLLCSATGE